MEEQIGSSSSEKPNTASGTKLHEIIFNNHVLHKLEEEGFITPDEKAKKLLTKLTETKFLYALKLLFENPLNQFSPRILRDSLVELSDPTPFDYYEKQSEVKLELHLRTYVAVLEHICFSPMRLSKELRDRVYNSLAIFSEVHRKTVQVMQEGINNNFRSSFDQFNQRNDDINERNNIKRRNYNIDFLLIHLRDTLHSLRDDETWYQEILRRAKDLLKSALNITPGILSNVAPIPNDNSSILNSLTQLRQGLSFKYPVASYYVDRRIMLIIQNNLFRWMEDKENIISKKFGERILIEYLWGYSEIEWNNVADKSMLDSQTKFDEVSNKLVKILSNSGSFINDLAGNEPLTLPNTLWFGILDLAQNLVLRSTQTVIYGLCYYLANESLTRAPNSFIQYKAVEILLHLQTINNESFPMIVDLDFDQYIQKLEPYASGKFQSLLSFAREKYHMDFNLLNDEIENEKGKGKGVDQNRKEKIIISFNILDVIADEMACPISNEPEEQLCILKCQHVLSLNNLNKLRQKICPKCREIIEENNIKYLSQMLFIKIYIHIFLTEDIFYLQLS
ncbi:15634_t:CDS:2 [Funneliformis caledonium]|uniref:15634_t:CDS:1 n=1 Tax=Funneliformis caledonium TaxID=1117310 RepID=A0A9N8YTN5_9GLOM|nr:15634_t:CDS:2 [Funneliformis caledonium]